jgi:alpha-tubulin N-acetyltransferase 1
MLFEFDVEAALKPNELGFAVLDGTLSLRKGPQHYASGMMVPPDQEKINRVIDELGALSSQSQMLPAQITTASRFFSSDNRMYIKVEGGRAIGLIKIGRRRLFVRDEVGSVKEIEPVCVLDFYVHESCQRSGFGRQLFEYMLD